MIDIRVSGLVKSFDLEKKILDGVSFQVDAGERVGLLGKNGAGKTTGNTPVGEQRGLIKYFNVLEFLCSCVYSHLVFLPFLVTANILHICRKVY